MIRYALRCSEGHGFEGWFRDSAAFDDQSAAGQVVCAVCGASKVEKALMAPSVAAVAQAPKEEAAPMLSAPVPPEVAEALASLRRKVEESADYVGPRFAEEARRIHAEGGAERPIWGEATPAQAKALRDDGVPVAPLPFLPKRDD